MITPDFWSIILGWVLGAVFGAAIVVVAVYLWTSHHD